MRILVKWDKEFSETGKMYLPVVNGKMGKPTGDLVKAKGQAERMVGNLLSKKQRVNMIILVYETALSGFQENCNWEDDADARKEERERAEYKRLKAKFEGEEYEYST